MLSGVESEVAGGRADETANSISVPISYLNSTDDPRLEPVRRWFELRHRATNGSAENDIVVLDGDAANALAALMQVSIPDLRAMLTERSA
jgi:hypothetical protein